MQRIAKNSSRTSSRKNKQKDRLSVLISKKRCETESGRFSHWKHETAMALSLWMKYI